MPKHQAMNIHMLCQLPNTSFCEPGRLSWPGRHRAQSKSPVHRLKPGLFWVTSENQEDRQLKVDLFYYPANPWASIKMSLILRAPRKISAFQCFCGHEKTAKLAA
jgi:hypothetical protein